MTKNQGNCTRVEVLVQFRKVQVVLNYLPKDLFQIVWAGWSQRSCPHRCEYEYQLFCCFLMSLGISIACDNKTVLRLNTDGRLVP